MIYKCNGVELSNFKIYVFLGYYASHSGNSLLTLRCNLSVPPSRWDS